MLFWYSSCDIFSAVLWSHCSSNSYYSQLVKQTDQKEETLKSSDTVQCRCEHILTVIREIYCDSTSDWSWHYYVIKKLKLREHSRGWGMVRSGWNISHHKQLQKVSEAQRKRVTKNEGEENHQRQNETDRDANRETQTERVKQNRR